MPVELFDVALELARKTVGTKRGSATAAGTTSTLIDTKRREDARAWTQGSLFLLSGTLARLFVEITKSDKNTFTFAAQASPPGSGARYEVCAQELNLDVMRRCVNTALTDLKDIRKENSALVTVANQEEYTLPAGVRDVKRVEIARQTATPFYFHTNNHWDEIGGKLRFASGWAPHYAGFTMRLTYLGPHAELDAAGDDVDQQIPLMALVWAAAVVFWRDEYRTTRGEQKDVEAWLNDATSNAGKNPSLVDRGRDPRYGDW